MKTKNSITQNKKPTRKKLEFQLQCQCVDWFRMQYPNEIIFAIPNGGSRNIVEAVNFKRMGVLAGVPDLFVPRGNSTYHGLFIEMKAGSGKLSESQSEISGILRTNGYAFSEVRTFEEFVTAIKIYYYKPKVL